MFRQLPLLLLAACSLNEPETGSTKSTGPEVLGSSSTPTSSWNSSSSSFLDNSSSWDSSSSSFLDNSSSSSEGSSSSSTVPACGDGHVDPEEGCDEGVGNNNHGTCKVDCTLPVCGDGFKQPGEPCDDGNDFLQDACTKGCKLNICGDGLLYTGVETCDGSDLPNKICDVDCTAPWCGDGLLNLAAGEVCDDGNLSNLDLCTAKCTPKSCGDGFIQWGENCEDGNLSDGDGCSSSCLKENIECKVIEDVVLGITVSVAPSNRAILCVDDPDSGPNYGPISYDNMCPKGWHMCSGSEFNARNKDWKYAPVKQVIGMVRCLVPGPGAGQLSFKPPTMETDILKENCDGPSGNIAMCGGGDNLSGEKFTYALCCAPLVTCGDGKLDPEEQCDDGNLIETDGCTPTCALSKCPA